MNAEDVRKGMPVVWEQNNADTNWQPNYVNATVIEVGNLIKIRTHDGLVRRVRAEKLRER